MTGYSSAEVMGKDLGILKSGKHRSTFYEGLWKTIKSGKTWRGRFTNKKKDGTLFEEDAVISPVFDEDGNIVNYVAVKQDVTDKDALQREILQSQKMAAIGQVAHRVAHDFTNVLVVILGNARLARDKVADMPDVCQNLDEVISASNRVTSLTAGLLSFAHRGALQLRPVKLQKALVGTEKMLRRIVTPDVEVLIRIEPGLRPVMADLNLIEQAIVHLALNAVDAMPEGGQLTIDAVPADCRKSEAARLPENIRGSRAISDFAVLRVSDTGAGMTNEMMTRIFEPFFTTKKEKQSAGLGLSTVYSIAERHNGHVAVDSKLGKGSIFRFYLPFAE
jgi:two-component system cell cycle sensor histidine kinase/response regulator CckA